MRKVSILVVFLLVCSFCPVVVAVADDSNDQYNAAHVQQMVDEAYQRACVATPSAGSATSGPSGGAHVDGYGYHEEFDHYDFSNAYVQLKGVSNYTHNNTSLTHFTNTDVIHF